MGAPGDRPHVVVNCAMSADGKIAMPGRRQLDISSEEDMLRVHRMRAGSDAILVGAGTVICDDPKLHVSPSRVPDPPAPLKVVLDATGRTPATARFIASPGPSLVATIAPTADALRARLGDAVEVVALGQGPLVDLGLLMAELHRRGVRRLMVEGGSTVIWSFFESGLVDEYSVYIGPLVVGGEGTPTPAGGCGVSDPAATVRLEMLSSERMGDGLWIRYAVRRHA
jgi:2,5-diamino-6-(ribosylamino)-4(3H)-pyrimidinone 5'-phosphate reductase